MCKEQECEYWKQELDKTHLLMLEKQDAYIAEFNKSYKYEQALDEIYKICHKQSDTLYPTVNPLKEISDIIDKIKEEK